MTPESLFQALSAISGSSDEEATANALESAATLVQDAILNDQPSDSFNAALSSCAAQHGKLLSAVLDRTVEFHPLRDGGRLALWLLPVVLGASSALPEVIVLDSTSLQSMRMASSLMSQLGLTATEEDKKADNPLGWTYVMPKLYSYESMQSAELGELVRLPHQARAVLRGERKRVSFEPGEQRKTDAGAGQLYFLPFVAYHPEGHQIDLPQASEAVIERMTRWVRTTLVQADGANSELDIRVAPQPQPFTFALTAGARMRQESRARFVISETIARSGIEANGMAALVAPYAVENAAGELTLGVSLVSRLTGDPLARIELPVEAEDGGDDAAMVTTILTQLGMKCAQYHSHPINTFACQECGSLQLSFPSPAVARHGVEPASSARH
ncbi:hypothetical protein G3A43_06315 [Paraburkholderia aspalathi]|nr:hypothetical protein [Paraburkholderia aspalathi]MBK3779862.1 hypothetical protein [Paraburkholderia aspalathi]